MNKVLVIPVESEYRLVCFTYSTSVLLVNLESIGANGTGELAGERKTNLHYNVEVPRRRRSRGSPEYLSTSTTEERARGLRELAGKQPEEQDR